MQLKEIMLLAGILWGGLSYGKPLNKIISAGQVNYLLANHAEKTVFIDTRSSFKFTLGHIPGAVRLSWTDYTRTVNGAQGISIPLADIQNKLPREIKSAKFHVVYGEGANGWGEEGRVLWMLESLGYKNISYLDGGYASWDKAEPIVSAFENRECNDPMERFQPLRSEPLFRFDALLKNKDKVTFIDVRLPEEYSGATPHGSKYGGHLPNAVNIPLKRLFTTKGLILKKEELIQSLKRSGIDLKKPMVTYCTGGVRSALFYWIVRHRAGFPDTFNYDGSWWEWSANVPG